MKTIIYKSFQRGFTFLELLITLCLFSISILMIEDAQLIALRMNQEAYHETAAAIQLKKLSTAMLLPISNFYEVYKQWQDENKMALPKGEGKIIQVNNQSIIRLYWQSASSSPWQCAESPQPNRACLQTRIVR